MKKDLYILTATLLLSAIALSLQGCSEPMEPPSYSSLPQKTEAGVLLVGSAGMRFGYLQNNNTYPVTIRGVGVNKGHGYKEVTRWVKMLPPETRYEFKYKYDDWMSFYIYRTGSGELLGFVTEFD